MQPSGHEVGAVDEGDDGPLRRRHGLAYVRPASFAVERRRGWTETPDSPPASPQDPWDESRAPHVTMQKPQPGGGQVLQVRGEYAAFRSFDMACYGESVRWEQDLSVLSPDPQPPPAEAGRWER